MSRYVYRPGHPKASERGFVDVRDLDDYGDGPLAINAPVMIDRFMEGSVSTDGVDIGSRKKRREYMRVNGVADAGDYSDDYRQRVHRSAELRDAKDRREAVARAFWQHTEGRRHK